MANEEKTVTEPIENTNTASTAPAEKSGNKKADKDHWELHDYLWLFAIIFGIISILWVLLAKNAINDKTNMVVFSFNFPWMAKPYLMKIAFLTGKLCGIVGAIFGALSIACGIGRNISRKQKSAISYLLGIAATVLSVIAYLAAYYKG